MESEIERLRTENERLKLRMEKLKNILGGLAFEQRMSISSIRGFSELMLKSEDEFSFSETQQAQYLSLIAHNGKQLTKFQTTAQDIARAIFDNEETFYPLIEFPKAFLALDSCKMAHFLEEGQAKLETSLVLLEEPFGIFCDRQALDIGLSRIAFHFREMNPEIPLEIYFSNDEVHFMVEISVELPAQIITKPEPWQERYEQGYADPASIAIFELYSGIWRIETKGNRLMSILALPLVGMEKADAE